MFSSNNANNSANKRTDSEGARGALCLTLYHNDMIKIGDDIVVTAKKYKANQIRLCVSAPKELRIKRVGTFNEEKP